jgi:predicted peroxiredoxin
MPRKPRTVADLAVELSARSEGLGESASLLQKASASLSEAPSYVPLGQSVRDLLRLGLRLNKCLQAAHACVSKAERLLDDDLKGVRRAAALIEREMGKRRAPGRPRALTELETHIARCGRERGRSWEQVRRTLNNMRGGPSSLSLSTLRSAVNPRPLR